ncbi:M15 family metallopeptidase [Bradyrhizobium elkanii]|uniref:M15 family metallopeptidase n=1 Tax=Bradyrhizobium elkanii TaxID=29448 RepID=UPI003A882766
MVFRVAGTGRMSMHGYAAAIDLNLKVSDHWLWAGKTIPCNNRMPRQIVDIVARHGFIWGRKWYHCDTMHLESRPDFPESEAACWRRSHAKLISLATKTR